MSDWSRSVAAIFIVLIAMGGKSLEGQEQTHPPERTHLYDRFQVSASAALLHLHTDIQVNGSNGRLGTDLDAESDLGAPRWLFEPALAVRWRPGRRHELELGYILARRSDQATLSQTIHFADTSFTAGLLIKNATQSDQASLAYRFALYAGERTQVGLGLGLGVLLLREELKAEAGLASGGSPLTGQYSVAKDALGPTASLGAYGRFYVGNHILPVVELRAIRVSIENFTASVIEGGAAVRYFVSKFWGGELGYSLGSYKVSLDEPSDGGRFLGSSITGKFTYTIQAFRAGVVFAF